MRVALHRIPQRFCVRLGVAEIVRLGAFFFYPAPKALHTQKKPVKNFFIVRAKLRGVSIEQITELKKKLGVD